MRNLSNAVTDTLREINANHHIREQVHMDPNQPNRRWIVILTLNAKILEVEVIQGDPNVFAGVLRREGFSAGFMERFMDTLMDNLEDD